MTMYYARLTGDIGAGAYLDVQSVSTDATKTSVAMAGGWHTYGGNWYVEGIYHSLGYIENGVDYSLIHTDNNRIWGAYDEQFNAAWPTLDRGAADRTVNLYSYIYCNVNGANREARAICTITVPHLPDEPTNLTATRQSDNRIALAWTAPTRTADGIAIDVQVDGGSWSTVAQLGSGTSYTYTGASADHSYKFRARASYVGAWSDYTAATAAVVMTPAAPTSISTAAAGGTTVDVTLVNSSPVATSIEYQVSTDGGETWGASATSSNLTSFSVTISGTGKIRVRNVNATGSSAWLTSETVTTICPPAAPTPRSPSGIVDMDAANVTFSWLFNSLDGSAQSAYELQYAINGGAAVTLTGTTAKQRDVAMTTFSAGDSVSWQVRTKGADPDWSEWSTAQTFYVYTAPTVAITSPGATITGMPISLAATYSDMPGFTCAAATASLTQNGRTLYSEPADINGSAITASLDVSEFLPANGESYTVVLDVRSSSSLYGSANATFLVDFTEPAAGDLQITNDGETGYVSLTALFDNHASDTTYDGTAGTDVTVQSAAVRSLAVDGMSVQNGTPTPDAPVGVQTVQGVNLIQLPTWEVLSTYSKTNNYYNYPIQAQPNTTYYLKTTGDAEYNAKKTLVLVASSKTNTAWKSICHTSSGIVDGTITTDSTGVLWLNVNSTQANYEYVLEHVVSVMINAGSVPLPYVPYGALGLAVTANGQTTVTPIDLQGNVLASLPDGTKDVLDVDSAGHVTITKNVGMLKIDGSTNPSTYSAYYAGFSFKPSPAMRTQNGNSDNGLCTHLPAGGYNQGYTYNNVRFGAGNEYIYFVSGEIGYTTKTDWTTWLTANPTTFAYPLATPTTVDLGYIDLPALADGATVDVMASLATSFELVGYDGSADAVSISVLRVNLDGSTTQLLADGESGAALVDMYAPLNMPYKYAVVTRAASQAVKTVYFDNELASVHWFAYWSGKVARATWNPSGQTSITRPEKKRVHYVGREYPVSYDSQAIDQSDSMSWTILPAEEADGFRELMRDGGRGVYKGCDGQVFHADFEYTSSADFWHITRNEQVSLTITRIDGEQL